MPDSNITKRALAASLKELMADIPFSKIRIGDICEKCNMNRKSFYYHFKDKYDLVNWIYYTEFISTMKNKKYDNVWELLMDICNYFYQNKSFYNKVLKIEGQNSFSDYFQKLCAPITAEYIKDLFEDTETSSFYVIFFVDGFIAAIKRWISNPNGVMPDEFVRLIYSCVYGAAKVPNEFPPVLKK